MRNSLTTRGLRPDFSGEPLGKSLAKMFGAQNAIIRQSQKKVKKNWDPDLIHDLRVAARRFRTLIRFFPGELEGTRAKELEGDLKALSKNVGIARDLDVWNIFLKKKAVAQAKKRLAAWTEYYKKQVKITVDARKSAGAFLQGKKVKLLFKEIDTFLMKELPVISRHTCMGQTFAEFTGTMIINVKKRLEKAALPDNPNPNDLHKFRKKIRRERYCVEFAIPYSGREAGPLAARLKAVTTLLGNIHDMDMFYTHIFLSKEEPPDGLADMLIGLRRRYLQLLYLAWNDLKKKIHKKVTIR